MSASLEVFHKALIDSASFGFRCPNCHRPMIKMKATFLFESTGEEIEADLPICEHCDFKTDVDTIQ